MLPYISTDELTQIFGGRFAFGTNGTCIMTEGQGTHMIGRAQKFVDYNLSGIYGTGDGTNGPFGTNAWGTGPVPELIKYCVADFAVGWIYENTRLPISERVADWKDMILSRGSTLLADLESAQKFVSPYFGTPSSGNVPYASGEYGTYTEQISFNGTELVTLTHRNILKNSLVMYGTDLDGPTIYQEGRDYNAYYQGLGTTGSNYGAIRNHGTGTVLGANATVWVNYWYSKSPVFKLRQHEHWGASEPR